MIVSPLFFKVGSVARWLGAWSLSDGLPWPAPYLWADRWPLWVNCPLCVSQLGLPSLWGRELHGLWGWIP